MFKALSNSSSSSHREFENVHHQSTFRRLSSPVCHNHHSLKKAFSSIFNSPHLETRGPPDEQEMYEIIRNSSSEENLNTIQPNESFVPDHTAAYHQSLSLHTSQSTTDRHRASVQRTFAHLKSKIKPFRHEQTNDSDKNHGYVLVGGPDSDSVVIAHDDLDQHATRHAQPCVQISEVHFNPDQIQYHLATAVTPSLSPAPSQPLLGLSRMLSEPNDELELLSTRSSVECAAPQADLLDANDVQMSEAITTSPSSTNSSSHQYSTVDRSLLSDTEYIEAQQLDLEQLTILEIRLTEERSSLQTALDLVLEFNESCEEALQTKLALQKELRALQQEYDLMNSSWLCRFCYYDNEPYSVTGRDVCSACESPSPLKEARLIR